MARSRWKLIYFDKDMWKNIKYFKKTSMKDYLLTLKNRKNTIPEIFIENNVEIHKGNRYRILKINEYNVGFKFSEFAFTRKPFYFPMRKSKKKIIQL